MDQQTVSTAMTAMCLWEDVMDTLRRPSSYSPYTLAVHTTREGDGMCSLRGNILSLAPACDEAWELAVKGGFLDCFDWEFCPWFLRNCVEWDSAAYLKTNWRGIVSERWALTD